MKSRIKIIFILLFFCLASPALATLYKSVDADGNVTYSQSPPDNGQYEKIKVKVSKPVSPSDASKKSADAKKTFEQGSESRKQNDLVKAESEKNKKIMEDNCNIAKKNLRLYTVYKRLKNDQGEYYRVDDNERAKGIKTAESNIKQFCK